MQENSKKVSLKTISAKIPAETKAALEEKATQAGMIKSDFLRMIIERSDIGENHPAKAPEVSATERGKTTDFDIIAMQQIITNQLQDIQKTQGILLQNDNDRSTYREKMFIASVIVSIGLMIAVQLWQHQNTN